MASESIEEIKQRFNQEWLLIEVTKSDEMDQPVEGRLLAHSPDHDELWRMSETKAEATDMSSNWASLHSHCHQLASRI